MRLIAADCELETLNWSKSKYE